ncbi:peptide ABC transporter ATP-binding protein, partial [Escherichia coli]|nr:peptide ABC transporter ATP-binding protein [Escherichia coli]
MIPLLRVSDLSVAYGKEQAALKHLSFEMHAGEVLGIVGESGSGKSTLLRALLGMLPNRGTYAGGDILFQGQSVIGLAPKDWSKIRGKRIAMVFQDSGSHLNP